MKVKNFDELGKVFRVKPKESKPTKPRKCNKCGGELHLVHGTNVYICDGIDPTSQRPYEHKVFSRKPAMV